MAIGVNWKEVWKPVWKTVWDQTGAAPETPIGVNWSPIWKQVWGTVWQQDAGGGAAFINSPLGTATSGTTATAGVTTDTASGTLYGLARIGGSAAIGSAIKASGQSVAVSTTTPSFSYTGLTPYSLYRIDYVQVVAGVDSNVVSNVVSSAEFASDNTGTGGGELGASGGAGSAVSVTAAGAGSAPGAFFSSGGAGSAVQVTAAGGGTGIYLAQGGAGALVYVVSVGGGSALGYMPEGGASAAVTVSAAGDGTGLTRFADQPETASSWSYLQTGTLWRLSAPAGWGTPRAFADPEWFLCDYAADNKVMVSQRGDEFTTRLLIYTSLPGVKAGDMLLIGRVSDADPVAAGAQEVKAVAAWADTFNAGGPEDFRIAT